jgi:hypothetical protein
VIAPLVRRDKRPILAQALKFVCVMPYPLCIGAVSATLFADFSAQLLKFWRCLVPRF